ncbi:MAG: alpha-1,2-fucosyltransferase [Bacteroidota bacterium]
MIGTIAMGRMGNQMFQLAFAYAAAKKLGTGYFIYGANGMKYFNLIPDFENINRKNIIQYGRNHFFSKSEVPFSWKKITDRCYRAVHKNKITWPNTLDENNYLLKEIKDDHVYEGFFQCEEYFSEYSNEIRSFFSLKENVVNKFRENKKYLLEKKYVALHIRRGDYLAHGGEELGGYDMTLPVSYYRDCLSQITADEYNVVFVSDDIEFVKKEFGRKENYFFENNDEITDFQVLLNADVLVIANSSFSWWAAWLNEKANKKVFAPEYYLGFKIKRYYPAGIKVKAWNWVNVNGKNE